MTKRLGWIVAFALTAVATSASAAPPTGGTISIEASVVDGSRGVAIPAFVDAASAALTSRGFTVLNAPGHSASVIEVIVSRADVGTGVASIPSEGASIAGKGVSIPLSNGGTQFVSLQRTRLEMRIRTRGVAGVVWDATAVTVREAGTRKGSAEAVAADLSRALLQAYPAQPSEIIGVP